MTGFSFLRVGNNERLAILILQKLKYNNGACYYELSSG